MAIITITNATSCVMPILESNRKGKKGTIIVFQQGTVNSPSGITSNINVQVFNGTSWINQQSFTFLTLQHEFELDGVTLQVGTQIRCIITTPTCGSYTSNSYTIN